MRIAFVGKGGSGKSTMSALYASYLSSFSKKVLLIDADVNMHAGVSLGFPEEKLHSLPSVGAFGLWIKKYLKGKNKKIEAPEEIIKTTPPSYGSNFVRFDSKNDPIIKKFTVEHGGVHIMNTGTFENRDIGSNCYHKYSGITEIVLNHFLDKPDEYILADMTAGLDTFGTGLFASFDITFCIVEPTKRSVDVFNKYRELTKQFNITVKAIGNKVSNKSDVEFLERSIPEDLIGYLGISETVKEFERSNLSAILYKNLHPDDQKMFQNLHLSVSNTTRDWKKLYKNLSELHRKNAENWANNEFGKDLREQIEASFSYEPLIN